MRSDDSIVLLLSGLALTVLVGCASDDASGAGTGASRGDSGKPCNVDTSYNPPFDPTKFVAAVDNPLFPLVPGTTLTYVGGEETIEFQVLAEKKQVAGVSATVIHDVVKVNGEIIEDTFDWFAQDETGAVWYLGEDTKELSGGQVTSTHGSWEAGVDGAKPGYIIPPNPTVGLKFRQEYYACEAEDFGEVLDLDASVTVLAGSYTGCLKTRDTTPLEPALKEEKYYCPGVGTVLVVDVTTQEREELERIARP
jgi:hypothetical protein